jgi:hypothetical protein
VAALVAIVFTFAWVALLLPDRNIIWNLDMRRPTPLSNPFIATMRYSVTFLCLFPFRLFYSAYGCGEGNPSNQSMKTTAPLLRIALEMILIAGWQMIWPQSTEKAQMKTILMLIVGLMLAGCGSMQNHIRNRDAVDAICACP